MALFKLELVFAIIMSIQKHMVMRLDREIALAIFLLWLDSVHGLTVSVAWPFAEKNIASWLLTSKGNLIFISLSFCAKLKKGFFRTKSFSTEFCATLVTPV